MEKTITEIKAELEAIVSGWNGETKQFVVGDTIYTEDSVSNAAYALEALETFKGYYENVGGQSF